MDYDRYHNAIYKNKGFKRDYELYQLFCVINKKKPLAMIGNDDPTFSHADSVENRKVQNAVYYALDNCNILRMVIGRDDIDSSSMNSDSSSMRDDPTRLYFYEENWTSACIMALFHEDKFSDKLIKIVLPMFEEFQAVLLGYTLNSCVNYRVTSYDKEFDSIQEKYKACYEEFHELYDWVKQSYTYVSWLIKEIKTILQTQINNGNYSLYNYTCGKLHKDQILKIGIKTDKNNISTLTIKTNASIKKDPIVERNYGKKKTRSSKKSVGKNRKRRSRKVKDLNDNDNDKDLI
jgi:hypothetical protein